MTGKTAGVRGEEKLCFLTYSQLAKWVGLSVSTVRSYSQRKEFERRDLESCLCWVNARRRAAGLPMVGDPDAVEPTVRRGRDGKLYAAY